MELHTTTINTATNVFGEIKDRLHGNGGQWILYQLITFVFFRGSVLRWYIQQVRKCQCEHQ